MEKLVSLQIDGTELELVEGAHFPSQVKAGNHRPGMHLDDLETYADGWVDAVVSPKHEDQIYGWLEKGHVHLLFKTEVGEFNFPNAELTTKEEDNEGVRISVNYRND